ncbi:hypothetical protein MSG28_003151 [Choristoneura fumiferana]|uniref:Uncharacterized protein n=1 Tax=Choristoneura fumiferana TaxID=7141 RepID=A0ACC0KEH4_CHOFU|nr:hypothetical protein MSG28_003151 [Choristoneura fumiferana]
MSFPNEAPLVYRTCVDCERTCDNYDELAKDPKKCGKQPTEGCFCPEGKVRVNNTCIEPTKCFPCDANHEHYAGDEWQEDACSKCTCSKQPGQNVAHVSCTKMTCSPPVCSPEEDLLSTPRVGACCNDYLCDWLTLPITTWCFQIKAWLSGDRSTRLCTARPTWQTMSFRQGLYKKTFTNIEVNLVDVLEVDKNNMRQSVANMVTNGPAGPARWKPLGLVPVAPSWTTESVSAWSMGTGVETCRTSTDCSSTSSTDENPDLFYAVPWSYGTLGFLASAVMKVIPAKKYVRLEYHPYTSLPELSKRFQEESLKQNPHQFVEALLYNKDQGVVMLGDMVDEIGSDGKYNPIGKWYSEWFFKQVEKHLNARQSIAHQEPFLGIASELVELDGEECFNGDSEAERATSIDAESAKVDRNNLTNKMLENPRLCHFKVRYLKNG